MSTSELKKVQSKLRACAQARTILCREHESAVRVAAKQQKEISELSRELDAMRRDRDECAAQRDYEKVRADTNAATLYTAREQRAERTRERDALRKAASETISKREYWRRSYQTAAKERDNARTLLEQAEYDRDRAQAIALRETERANDNARRLVYLRETATDQCTYAGITK